MFSRTIKLHLIIIFILNLIDTISTFYGVFKGYFIELNPLFARILYPRDFRIFFFVKIILLSILLFCLYWLEHETKRISNNKLLRILIYLTTVTYVGLIIYHIILWLYIKADIDLLTPMMRFIFIFRQFLHLFLPF